MAGPVKRRYVGMNHQEGYFQGYQDFKIYHQCWLPDSQPRAVLLLAHGYAEHSGRYKNIVDYFVPQNYAIYALDHRGHGKSDGERVHVEDFHDYVVDLKTYFDIVRSKNPAKKIFLIGHSMGSVISLRYCLEYQSELSGLITSGGGLSRAGDPPLQAPPKGQALSVAMLSRDPAVIEAYVNDPLVYHGPVPTNHSMRGTMANLVAEVGQIKLPVLIMAGAGGRDGARSQVLFDLIGSQDKTFKPYAGLLHEIFNEPEYPQVMADTDQWLQNHL
jgi:acylglycerol lipase